MELARNCLRHGLEEWASEVMRDVTSNAPDDAALARTMSVFEQAGRQDLAQQVVSESRRQVGELVLFDAEKARQGDYRSAVELMTAAACKLSENSQIVFNAVVALRKYLDNIAWEQRLGEQLRLHINTARRLDHENPRLFTLVDLRQALLKKYNVRPPNMSVA